MATDDTTQNIDSPNVLMPSQPARWTLLHGQNWGRTQALLSPAQRIQGLITAFYEFRRDVADNPALASDVERRGALTRETESIQRGLNSLGFHSNDGANLLSTSQVPVAYLNILRAVQIDGTVLQQELRSVAARLRQLNGETQYLNSLPTALRDTLLRSDTFYDYLMTLNSVLATTRQLSTEGNRLLNEGSPSEVTDFVRELRNEDFLDSIRQLSGLRAIAHGELVTALSTQNLSPSAQHGDGPSTSASAQQPYGSALQRARLQRISLTLQGVVQSVRDSNADIMEDVTQAWDRLALDANDSIVYISTLESNRQRRVIDTLDTLFELTSWIQTAGRHLTTLNTSTGLAESTALAEAEEFISLIRDELLASSRTRSADAQNRIQIRADLQRAWTVLQSRTTQYLADHPEGQVFYNRMRTQRGGDVNNAQPIIEGLRLQVIRAITSLIIDAQELTDHMNTLDGGGAVSPAVIISMRGLLQELSTREYDIAPRQQRRNDLQTAQAAVQSATTQFLAAHPEGQNYYNRMASQTGGGVNNEEPITEVLSSLVLRSIQQLIWDRDDLTTHITRLLDGGAEDSPADISSMRGILQELSTREYEVSPTRQLRSDLQTAQNALRSARERLINNNPALENVDSALARGNTNLDNVLENFPPANIPALSLFSQMLNDDRTLTDHISALRRPGATDTDQTRMRAFMDELPARDYNNAPSTNISSSAPPIGLPSSSSVQIAPAPSSSAQPLEPDQGDLVIFNQLALMELDQGDLVIFNRVALNNYLELFEERGRTMQQLLDQLQGGAGRRVLNQYQRNQVAPGAGMTEERVQEYLEQNADLISRTRRTIDSAGGYNLSGMRQLRRDLDTDLQSFEAQDQVIEGALARLEQLSESITALPSYRQVVISTLMNEPTGIAPPVMVPSPIQEPLQPVHDVIPVAPLQSDDAPTENPAPLSTSMESTPTPTPTPTPTSSAHRPPQQVFTPAAVDWDLSDLAHVLHYDGERSTPQLPSP